MLLLISSARELSQEFSAKESIKFELEAINYHIVIQDLYFFVNYFSLSVHVLGVLFSMVVKLGQFKKMTWTDYCAMIETGCVKALLQIRKYKDEFIRDVCL